MARLYPPLSIMQMIVGMEKRAFAAELRVDFLNDDVRRILKRHYQLDDRFLQVTRGP